MSQVFSKINRVNYGLLSAEEQQADMPTSRKLLAVPFLGKDVPSPASEYAHPDIVIGFTILAYRHEGMRRDDFKKVMRALLEELEFQGGPVESRPAYKIFSGWVAAAGGRVRGTRVEPGAPDVPAEFANVSLATAAALATPRALACCELGRSTRDTLRGEASAALLRSIPPLHARLSCPSSQPRLTRPQCGG